MDNESHDKFALNLVRRLGAECENGMERIQAFTRYSRQVEGWFKGELLRIAAEMEDGGQVAEFQPDCRFDPASSKRNIDLRFTLASGSSIWIELKHWYLGRYPLGGNWKATTYFTQSTSATPNNFISKLPTGWADPTYMLIATTPTPSPDDWYTGLDRLCERHGERGIVSLTKPEKFPEEFYLALLKVAETGRSRVMEQAKKKAGVRGIV